MSMQNGRSSAQNSSSHSDAPNLDDSILGNSVFDPVRAETALWRAVITQALMDAGSESRKPEAAQEKRQAIRWLLGNSEDFTTVCLNADLDPAYVRNKAVAAIERGCVWRQGMAEKRLGKAAKSLPTTYEKKSIDFTSPPPRRRAPAPPAVLRKPLHLLGTPRGHSVTHAATAPLSRSLTHVTLH